MFLCLFSIQLWGCLGLPCLHIDNKQTSQFRSAPMSYWRDMPCYSLSRDPSFLSDPKVRLEMEKAFKLVAPSTWDELQRDMVYTSFITLHCSGWHSHEDYILLHWLICVAPWNFSETHEQCCPFDCQIGYFQSRHVFCFFGSNVEHIMLSEGDTTTLKRRVQRSCRRKWTKRQSCSKSGL